MKRFIENISSNPALAEKEEKNSKKRKIAESNSNTSSSSSSTAITDVGVSAIAAAQSVTGFNHLPDEVKVIIFKMLDVQALLQAMLGFGKKNYQLIIDPNLNIIDFSHDFWLTNPLRTIPSFIQEKLFIEQTQEINSYTLDPAVNTTKINAAFDKIIYGTNSWGGSEKAFNMLLRSLGMAADLPNTLTTHNLRERHQWLNHINIWLFQIQVRLSRYNSQHEFGCSTNLLTRLPQVLFKQEFAPTKTPSWLISLFNKVAFNIMNVRQQGYWQNLTHMNLSHQQLQRLPSLKSLTALVGLNVSHNEIKQVPPLPNSLVVLNFSDNCLRNLPFDLPLAIEQLDVTQNFLVELPFISYQRPILFEFGNQCRSLSWTETLTTQKVEGEGQANNIQGPGLN